MMFDQLMEIVQNVIPEVNSDDIHEDSLLVEDLGLNSLTMMLLAVSIEDEYGITFDDSAKLETVNDVISYIEDKTQK